MSLDIVVAHYKESLDWLSDLMSVLPPRFTQIRVFVYDKGGEGIPAPIAVQRSSLPNVGMCDHTYLWHIVHFYDKLAEVTVFLPGSILQKHLLPRLLKALQANDTVVFVDKLGKGLNFQIDAYQPANVSATDSIRAQPFCKAPIRPFSKWFYAVMQYDSVRIPFYRPGYKGVFSASRSALRAHPVSFYKSLLALVGDCASGETAHYMERSWASILHTPTTRKLSQGVSLYAPGILLASCAAIGAAIALVVAG